MIFQHTLEQILSQRKTQTRRIVHRNEAAVRGRFNRIEAVLHNERIKWQIGNTYAVQPGRGKSQIARIEITQINSESITRISTQDAIAEGFECRQHFLQTWREIHGENSFNVRVWVLNFELVEYASLSKMPHMQGVTHV